MPTLEFKGKQHIYAHHLTVPYRPLVSDASKSVPPPRSDISSDVVPDDDNLIIHGDNLHALKALLPRYAGRVKCIYIDPPYNTGNENWHYNDNVNSPLMQDWLEQNGPVDGEDLERHDKWLAMMWPRLHLLRDLLSDDGVIFISIDDNEQHHLRMLMDDVFGRENYVACIPWQSRTSVQNDTDISINHEYLLAFARVRRRTDRRLKASNVDRWNSVEGFAMNPRPVSDKRFSNPDNDSRGPWRLDLFHAPNIRPNLTYAIRNPDTGQSFWPPPNRCWRMTEQRFTELFEDNRIAFGKNGDGQPQLKVFLNEVSEFGQVATTWFDASENGTVAKGTQQLKDIFGGERAFDYPKPIELIQHLLRLATREEAIILDSFAGSGTTAHAVLALNKEDGGNRKFILVECEDYADTITAERVRRVISGVPNAKGKSLREGLGGSFTYAKLGEPIDVESLLIGDALPEFGKLAAWLLHTARGVSLHPDDLKAVANDETGLFFSTSDTNFHLLYRPDIEWLRGNDGMVNEDKARHISVAARESGREAIVFAPGKYIGQRELTDMGITFCQLPYELYRRRKVSEA